MKNPISIFTLVSAILLSAIFAINFSYASSEDEEHAAEPKAPARSGEELAQACAACHGADGVSISPAFPNIAGQYRSYLIYSMKEYRSGNRNNAVMAGFVAGLSDEEIKNLADFYSQKEGLKILP